MRISYCIVFLSFVPFLVTSLKCLSGHPQSPSVCTSLTYCVTLKSKTGPPQHSCDGNSVGQISLCSRAGSRSRMTSLTSNSDYYYGAHSSISGSSRSSRVSSSSHQQQPTDHSCFDGGDLGQICCCSTDYCNSSKISTFSLLLIIPFLLNLYL